MIVKIQRAYRRWVMQERLRALVHGYIQSEESASLRRRTYALKEIISTEETYVANLRVLLDSYVTPLQAGGILSPSEAEGIFCNITHICAINSEFLDALRGQMQKWPSVTEFGATFGRINHMMPLYSLYMRRYEQSSRILCGCLISKPELVQFLSKAPFKDLSHFLIMPIQRLPRYQMLLDTLLRFTPTEHLDRAPLTAALQQVTRVVVTINESKRQEEEMALLKSTLVGFDKLTPMPLDMPDRRLLFSGYVTPISSRPLEHRLRQLIRWILFNDVLIEAMVTRDNKLEANAFYLHRSFEVVRVLEPQLSFCIVLKTSAQMSLFFAATVSSPEEVDAWVRLSPAAVPALPNLRLSPSVNGVLSVSLIRVSGLPFLLSGEKVSCDFVVSKKRQCVSSPSLVDAAGTTTEWNGEERIEFHLSSTMGLQATSRSAARVALHSKFYRLFLYSKLRIIIKHSRSTVKEIVYASVALPVGWLCQLEPNLYQIPLTPESTNKPLQFGATLECYLRFNPH